MTTPTIALVDDDRNILTSVSIALEAEGFDVKTYSDPAAALAALSQQPPDIAVLDIKMPRMDGMEVLRRLRLKSDLPVIFLTSKDEEIDEVLGLRMGADDYIRKPFSQARGKRQDHDARQADHGPDAACLPVEWRAGHPHRDRISDPHGAGTTARIRQKPRQPDGRCLR